jgi:hypothetical protein
MSASRPRKQDAVHAVVTEGDGRPQVHADRRTGARRGQAARPELNAHLLVRIPREELRWFRQYAFDHEEPMAELVRRVLHEFRTAHSAR